MNTAEDIIVKLKELGQHNSLKEFMLVPSKGEINIKTLLQKFELLKWIK